ncbi:MAG: glutamate--tRNA ligase family protein [Acidimicrobiales bacterium]
MCTRFAPSPNGPLHVGHARTGVFNWILARQRGGRYFVRFERTDRPREAPGARASMVEDLEWLGLLGEEDPHDQVDLVDHHRVALNRLVEGGYTYADGDAVRFRVPAEGSVRWDDVVRGPIEVANEDLDDPVLVRSSGAPTFFLASTADDSHDQVSDLIRPDVLLRASAKQLHIWEALGHRPPRIGHHPLMKRLGGQNVTAAGDGSVQRLREAGIHPSAVVAYLAMPQVASWKAGPGRLEDVIERFDPRRVSRRPMAFDVRALEVLNRRLAASG